MANQKTVKKTAGADGREYKKQIVKSVCMWWTIGVLGVIVLFLVASFLVCELCANPLDGDILYSRVTSVLSLVGTLTSIILSVFAIFYSYISGESTSSKIDYMGYQMRQPNNPKYSQGTTAMTPGNDI